MRIVGIDNLYIKIEKKILLAKGYTENDNLEWIIKSCRLKPADMYQGNFSNFELEKKWVDEYGNSLNIIKNKRIKIIENDLSIDLNKLKCTDLYYGLPLSKVSKISKLIYLMIGKDEDFLTDHLIISFLGVDNYLRTYYIYEGLLEDCSSLNLGMKVLKSISENKDIKYYLELNNRDKVIFPCVSQKSWISFWPPPEKFIETISKENNLVLELLKE